MDKIGKQLLKTKPEEETNEKDVQSWWRLDEGRHIFLDSIDKFAAFRTAFRLNFRHNRLYQGTAHIHHIDQHRCRSNHFENDGSYFLIDESGLKQLGHHLNDAGIFETEPESLPGVQDIAQHYHQRNDIHFERHRLQDFETCEILRTMDRPTGRTRFSHRRSKKEQSKLLFNPFGRSEMCSNLLIALHILFRYFYRALLDSFNFDRITQITAVFFKSSLFIW